MIIEKVEPAGNEPEGYTEEAAELRARFEAEVVILAVEDGNKGSGLHINTRGEGGTPERLETIRRVIAMLQYVVESVERGEMSGGN